MPGRRQSIWRLFWKQRSLQLFALSGVAFVLLFYYVPMSGLLMAFKRFKIQTGYAGIFTSEWVGFKWFHRVFYGLQFPASC